MRSPAPLNHASKREEAAVGALWGLLVVFTTPSAAGLSPSNGALKAQLRLLAASRAISVGGFWSEKGGKGTGWRQAFNYRSSCAVIEMVMSLSTALAAVVWSCDPTSHVHSSIVNVPKRRVAWWRGFSVVHSCLFPSVFQAFMVLKLPS